MEQDVTEKWPHTSFHPLHKNVILLTSNAWTSKGWTVLCVGTLIHIALKNVQWDAKWGVRSSLYALFQIGSNLVPLLSMYLPLSLIPPPLICDCEASTHYPPEVWSITSGFQRIRWERQKGSRWVQCWGHWGSGYHNPAIFKMPDAL